MKDHVIDALTLFTNRAMKRSVLLVSKDKASADAFIKKMQQPGPHTIQVPRGTKIHQYRPQTIIIDDLEEDSVSFTPEELSRMWDPDYYEDHEIQPPNLTDYEQVELK